MNLFLKQSKTAKLTHKNDKLEQSIIKGYEDYILHGQIFLASKIHT